MPVSVRARLPAALDEGHLVGALHLALDLGLADDHRVEPRGHLEQMADRLLVAQRVDRVHQLGRADVGLARHARERGALGLDRVARHEVDLGAVAGGDRHGLVDLVVAHDLAQHAGGAARRQGDPLAQGQRRGLVRHPDGEQRAAAHRSRCSARSVSVDSSRSIRCIFAAMIAT
jgi:hypothetical protein